jgi:hypothetical protein
MKSLIEFPEEVTTPLSLSPIQLQSCQAYFESIGLVHSDSETEETTFLTSTDSESDGSDFDENDIAYQDSSADGITGGDDDAGIQHDVTSTDNDTIPRQERSVSFGPIHVRQYERIVGDHPETKVGVPLSLGWAYYEDDRHPDGISIDRYECDRICRGKIRMSSITRKNLLLHVFMLPEEEIRLAEQRSKKLRKKREKAKREQLGITQTTLKKFGKKIRKGGVSLLKGMSNASQISGSASFAVAVAF